MALNITGDAPADALLTDDPFALLVGMLLDQQIPTEVAFAGPASIRDRLGSVDPAAIAGIDPERFLESFPESPAVHRFPGSMSARVGCRLGRPAAWAARRNCCDSATAGGRRRGSVRRARKSAGVATRSARGGAWQRRRRAEQGSNRFDMGG